MKIALISLNTKFIHTNLAIRYLAECVRDMHETKIFDFTIHDQPVLMAEEISQYQPDLVGFSMYLWNRHETIRVARIIKRVLPDAFLLLGGAEVTHDPLALMREYAEIDGIIQGEGEAAFICLANNLTLGNERRLVPNLTWRHHNKIFQNPRTLPANNMDLVPFPYACTTAWDAHRIYYYESSRGCPFACSFCMSSLDRTVRCLSWPRVKKDLDYLLQSGIHLVKFVDRTFNWERSRALQIWQYLTDRYNPNMVFHFEIAADLLDDAAIEFLKTVPAGYFQFEIGVQSTNLQTLEAIERQTDLERLSKAVKMLRFADNIHLHLDLIIGLPLEDMASFRESFNRVYAMGAHQVQVGILKLLPGTKIHGNAAEWDYLYMPDPPYQVLANRWLNFYQVGHLNAVAGVFEIYGNSQRFVHSLDFLVDQNKDAFSLFSSFADYWHTLGLHRYGTGMQEHFSIIARFASERFPLLYDRFIEILKFDYCLAGKPAQHPYWFPITETISGHCKQKLLHQLIPTKLPHLAGEGAAAVRRYTDIVSFAFDWTDDHSGPVTILFDYSRKEKGQPASWFKVDRQLCREILDTHEEEV